MTFLFFLVSFLASTAGSICGIGGGVIIKPVLDAVHVMSVSSISFLSGCTVLSMTVISVGKSFRNSSEKIDWKTGTFLAVGAAAGGVLGKILFQSIKEAVGNENTVGMVQSFVLLFITATTFFYTLKKEKIHTYHIKNEGICMITGLLLGIFSAFLGIGGGPVNLMVLSLLFSMETKKAALHSLYVILFSQAANLLYAAVTHTIPEISPLYFLALASGGILGAMAGNWWNKKMDAKTVDRLFLILMVVIMAINCYNIYKFA